jgi:CspA family cold shock protein
MTTPKDSFTLRSPKNDRQWQPRRRGYDDDNLYGNAPAPVNFPSFSTSSSAPEVQATVKWFNGEKGYGFVAMNDGSGDVFLHVNALQAAGYQTVSPGATMQVRVGQGQKGRQIDQVLSVNESTAEAPARRPMGGPGGGGFGGAPRTDRPRRQVDLSSAVEMSGTVKWYNADKGFGFISPDGGGKDVFVHATVLERSGLTSLQDGQAVRMGVVQGAKGPEAGTISLA